MINSEQKLSEKLNLVRWEEEAPRRYFDLTTIHSLTIDSNPKFKELKEIIQNYNEQQRPERIRYQQKYIQNLFKMLSELSRIPLIESQVLFLQKIHKWAFNGQGPSQQRNQKYSKSRPGTATTRTRPATAYSRPPTGISRPATAKLTTLRTKPQGQHIIMNKDDPRIDYNKLKPGEQEFYAGIRTRHTEYQHPKKRLKQYQRNVFYQDQQDSDVEIIDLDEKEKPNPLKQLKLSEEELINELQAAQENQEGQEELQGAEGAEGAQGANIDDIPLQGEEAGVAQVQQQKQIIDKLKPRLKAYGCPPGQKISKKNYEHGMQEYREKREYLQRKLNEDKQFAFLQTKWAQEKAKSNSQMRRRAESARIATKKIGIEFSKNVQPPHNAENIVNFENVIPVEVNTKGSRPSTAFRADNPKNRQELIKNAFITGKLLGHVPKLPEHIQTQPKPDLATFTVVGEKPKKRNFEDILREAEERVARQAEDEIENVKQTLAKAKVSLGANKIAKSISYYDRQLPDVWVGGVAGMGMLKNPFIKVSKKKKKKKKK